MTTQDDVERFLNQFHTKLKIYDIIFRDDRGKNLQALAELDITSNYRLEVIKTIQIPNNKTICISFHKAEYNMSYPFKKL